MYARLGEGGHVEWVRNWREATTFLTEASAELARDAALMDAPEREIKIAQRFRDWQAWKKKPKPAPAKRAKRAKKPAKKERITDAATDAAPPATASSEASS